MATQVAPLLEQCLQALQRSSDGTLRAAPGALARIKRDLLAIGDGEALYGLLGQLSDVIGVLSGELNAAAAASDFSTLLEPIAQRVEALARSDGAEARAQRVARKMALDKARRANQNEFSPKPSLEGTGKTGLKLRGR